MTKQISIIGCGWLGLPLAEHLITLNYTIKGSTTSKNKLGSLQSRGIDGYYVELTNNTVKGDIETCLAGSDILIFNIPPGLRRDPEGDFVGKIRLLIPYIEKSSVKKVLFVSSTSVYGDLESIPTITEATVPNPDSESGKQLLEVEGLLKTTKAFSTTILRFAGLFGDDRHPATSLSGKTHIKNPDAPVNLIHLTDCIHICAEILTQDVFGNLFNASTIPHPSRKHYYTSLCQSMNLPLPQFDTGAPSKGKFIASNKLLDLLNYSFVVTLNN